MRIARVYAAVALLAPAALWVAAAPQDRLVLNRARAIAAWFLQVPEALLETAAAEDLGLARRLADQPGALRSWWRAKSAWRGTADGAPLGAEVYLPDSHSFSVFAVWPLVQATKGLGSQASKAQAVQIAQRFLRARGLHNLALKGCYEAVSDLQRVLVYSVYFEGRTATGWTYAALTVNAATGRLETASYGVYEGPPPSKPPRVTMSQARTMVLKEAARRGDADLTISEELFSTAMPGFPVGRPMYRFILVGVRPYRGVPAHVDQTWFVDAWDLRVGRALEFPEYKRWNDAGMKALLRRVPAPSGRSRR